MLGETFLENFLGGWSSLFCFIYSIQTLLLYYLASSIILHTYSIKMQSLIALFATLSRRKLNQRRVIESSKKKQADTYNTTAVTVIEPKKREVVIQFEKDQKYCSLRELETLQLHVVNILLGHYMIDNDFEIIYATSATQISQVEDSLTATSSETSTSYYYLCFVVTVPL